MSTAQAGEQIILKVENLSHKGEGVGRIQGQVVFVPLAAPGDRVRAKVVEVRKKYLRAELEEVLSAGESRCQTRCPSLLSCGGCHIQHLDYRHQLEYKTGLVRESLARIGGLSGVNVLPAIGMENPWHYRNKVRLHAGLRGGKVVLGLYAPGSHTLGCTLAEDTVCHLLDQDLNRLALVAGRLLNKYRDDLFRGREGLLHYITLRKAAGTGETMVVLGARKDRWPGQESLVGELAGSGRVTTVVLQRAGGVDPVGGAQERVLYGRGTITDSLDNLFFRLSAASFYQVNPVQTRVLYDQALACARLTGREQVLDAYCGVGAISLYLARRALHVLGMEMSPAAVADARENAALNQITNATFLEGEVEKSLPRTLRQGVRPDLLILDPPRRGCRKPVLDALAAYPVPRIIYISCDPGTLARDLAALAGSGYRVDEVQPVDMFPHTHHVESIILMTKCGSEDKK